MYCKIWIILFGWYKFKYAQGENWETIWQGIDSANEVIFIPFLLHDCICFYNSLCSIYLMDIFLSKVICCSSAFMCFLEIHLPDTVQKNFIICISRQTKNLHSPKTISYLDQSFRFAPTPLINKKVKFG